MSDLDKILLLYNLRRNARLTTDKLVRLQEKKLRALVFHAYRHVEYYHKKLDSVGLKPDDIRTADDLNRIPLTYRKDLRDNLPRKIIADNIDLRRCTPYLTSGSTGMPLTVYVDPKGNDYRAALFGRPFFECGVSVFDKMVFASPYRHIPKKPYWFQRLGFLRRKYFSVTESVEEALPRIMEYRPDAIFAYASYLSLMAQALKRIGIKDHSLKRVFSTAEVLTEQAREEIEPVLGEVFDLYGSVETERLAWECEEHHGYHLDIDSAVIEFIKDGESVAPGEEGRIVVTSLYNYAMPLIRYEIGDIGIPVDEKCPCGRGLPLMSKVLGRQDDLIVCPDGRVITPFGLLAIMRSARGIAQSRIVQESKTELNIAVVKSEEFSEDTIHNTVEEITRLLGEEMTVKIEVVDNIPKDESGKLRIIISHVNR